MNTTVRKNGRAYDSGDVNVTILGQIFDEISQITYSTDQAHQLNYGLGNRATSWSAGQISHAASVTFYMADQVRLENIAGGDLIGLKPFDIIVSFTNEDHDIIIDRITAKFQSQGREVTGDPALSRQFDLFVLDVKRVK